MVQAIRVNKYRKLGLQVPTEMEDPEEDPLYDDEDTLWEVTRHVDGIVVVPKTEDTQPTKAQELARKVIEDYEGVVLREKKTGWENP